MKIGIVVPTYEGNPENERAEALANAAMDYAETILSNVEFREFTIEGVKVEIGPEGDVKRFNARDREIAHQRWRGMRESFAAGCDAVLMVDTDVIYGPDFFLQMITYFPNAEAKTCHVRGSSSAQCRHVSITHELLPESLVEQAYAGEVLWISKSAWDRMDHTVAEDRANEDYEIGDKLHAAGVPNYKVVPYHAWAD